MSSRTSNRGRFALAYPWMLHRKLALKAAPFLTRRGLGRYSLLLLTPLERHGKANVQVMEALFRTYGKMGRPAEATQYRAKILRGRATRAAKARGMDRPVQNLLRALAGLDEMQLAAPLAATMRLTTLMAHEDGQAALLEASEPLIAEYPDNILMIYVRAVALARADRIDEAAALVQSATTVVMGRQTNTSAQERERRAMLTHLANIWRVVDAIARDKMAWAVGGSEADVAEPSDGADSAKGEKEGEGEDEAGVDAPIEQEALLQGRRQSRYLAACRRRFQTAPSVREKLIAIRDMLRQGLRRMPSYHEAYATARKAYVTVREQWTPLLAGDDGPDPELIGDDGGIRTVRLLIQALQLARELEMEQDQALLEASLLAYGSAREARTVSWTISAVLMEGDPEQHLEATTRIVEAAGAPEKPHEVRDLFSWAARARRHDLAHAYFETAPEPVRRSYAAIHYAKILQREGEFNRALQLVRNIAGTVLGTPRAFCPFRHWGLMRRISELEFLTDSAKWFRTVPQPRDPQGVVMLAPRNAGQLTKYPMAVLLELKKQGWAVIPLVEGVLPPEPTGDERIDQFIGCMLQDLRLDPVQSRSFRAIKGFSPHIERGEFTWGGMDLSQPLWEEGAINRRRYNVDFTCPSLQKFLGRLVEWSRLYGTVLHNADKTFGRMKLRAGTMVPLQARLPDAVVRFYCEQKGDPEMFFCLHASNGYENYFANFSRSFSTKCGMRNVTANPELRTASFPIPAEFHAWYDSRKVAGAEMLERVRDTTRVRRSTRTTLEPPPEAIACIERVREWKARGGKVACAFGKVVCDMAAPTDGGPAHRNLKDWLNHTIESVRESNTLLLIKPHPHELRNEIATFLTEYMTDLIEVDLPHNVIITGQDWFDISDLEPLIDLGLLYNGTTAVELGLMNIPAVLCAYFAATDYPIGHVAPKSRDHYRQLVRFEAQATVAPDLPRRAAAWIHYMSGDEVTIPYRYHARPLTNKVTTPPRWFEEDITAYLRRGDPNVERLARRIIDPPATPSRTSKRRRPAAARTASTSARTRSRTAPARRNAIPIAE
ncbi:MAG: hypothetical protein ACK4FB_10055 [Brevundimonas sp.]|uniref:hypothetical protein n=1 Tax=Brevundimonas sp. TaxID=1871086 RepID=UPI00391A51AB